MSDHVGPAPSRPRSPTSTAATAEVLGAASALIAAFSAHDVHGYFSSFHEDASFLFHDADELITARAAYEEIWRGWEQSGFRVLGCRSIQPRAQFVSDNTAVFSHRVRTRLAGEEGERCERETIVFSRDGTGRWLGVHEHLSVDPQESERGQS
jgi:ketosteroid isomerase-like protein